MSKLLKSENGSLSYPYKVSQKLSKSDTDKLKKLFLKVFILIRKRKDTLPNTNGFIYKKQKQNRIRKTGLKGPWDVCLFILSYL